MKKRLQLPHDFAQKILDNQIEFKLSQNLSSQIICNLVDLYSKGVQYYESIKSYKYMYFKKKMEEIFLTDKNIFQGQNQQTKIHQQQHFLKQERNKNNTKIKEFTQVQSKQQKLQRQMKDNIQQSKKEVEGIMKISQEKHKKIKIKLKNQLNKQQKQLQQKLMQRKRKIFCRSFSSFGQTQRINQLNVQSRMDLQIKQPVKIYFKDIINDEDSDNENYKQQKINNKIPSLINFIQ